MFHHQRLRCYEVALNIARGVPGLVSGWPRGNAPLEDQLKRAVASIAFNISEGNGRRGAKDQVRFFEIARASAAEAAAVIDVAVAYRLMADNRGADIQEKLLAIVKMLWKLR